MPIREVSMNQHHNHTKENTMNTTTAAEAPSTDALRLWLDLVEDKLKGDYDTGELRRLVIDCDIDPRLTSDSARQFAALVQEVVSSAHLAVLIHNDHFGRVDDVKARSEGIKTCGVDSIANAIIGELGHLSPEDRCGRRDAILAELRGRLEV